MTSALVIATVLATSKSAPVPRQEQTVLPSGEVFTITEKLGAAPLVPLPGKKLLNECEIRLVGRGGTVILDTKSRGLSYWVESIDLPTSMIDLSVAGLGAGGSRVMSQPDTGLFLWITVLQQRSN